MNLPKNAAKWPILAVLLISGRVAFAADPSVRDYFSAQALSFGQQHREKVFLAQDKNAGFTFFSPEVADVKAEGNALSFRVTAKKATLGWGNYMGKQPVAERPDLWAETNWVSLRMKHSSTKPTALRLQFWVDGQREKAKRGGPEDLAIQAEMKGTDWQDVAFQPKRPQLVIPDGFEVEMEGEEGNRIQIESVKVIQPVRQGYVRKEFELPAGAKVWKAVAEVGSGNDVVWYSSRIQSELHVNGKKVARRGSPHIYQTSGVDIAPYLKPGKNCIGFYGSRIGSYDPFIYFQAKIVLTTGEVLTWATDTSWRWSPGEAAGWSQPGFDDRAWKEAAKGSVGDTYLNLGDIPAHQGLIELRNPVGARLVFKDTQPVVLEVRVPEGLAGQRPVVDYALARVEKAKVSPPASAQAATFTKDAASLVYALNLGPQPRGVYTVELKLKAGDNVLEERPREPLLVVGRIPMKDVPGDTHADGLDLEL
ncbi:MAG: hypothetical protein FJ272_22150, partial [Planctomycetes bacterium]|nr:hypothetical protein [Planctomycetota bacterium]